MYSRFSRNSEADASELLENIEDIFLGTICTVVSSACSNIQLHNVAKGLIFM